jgi:Uma2 family endonuclease
MSEHIRRIIMGDDLVRPADVRRDPKNGEQTGYPIIPPDGSSGAHRVALMLFLSAFVKARQLGRVFGDEVSFNLDDASAGGIMAAVTPEISFVSYERMPADAYEDVTLQLAPDLLVEAAPPDEIVEKAAAYLERGVGLVWLVDPSHREIHVYSTANPSGAILSLDDDLSGDGPLAAFHVPMRAIFEEDKALQVEVLMKLMGGRP